jgi:colanic acid/amylovoran biosynthesis glycosyltransferase
MNITFLAHSFPKISETFILNQLIGLCNRGEIVRIFSEAKPDDTLTHQKFQKYNFQNKTTYTANPENYLDGIQALGQSLPVLFKSQEVTFWKLLSEFKTLQSAPRRLANIAAVAHSSPNNTDIYHAHFGTVGNSFLGVAKSFDKPYVVSFYGRDASELLRKDPTRYNNLFERADAVTVLSNDMKSSLVDAGCPVSKISIQPLCIDIGQFSFVERSLGDEEPIRLLSVARFVEKKGLEYAIRAVAKLTESYNVTYRVAGDGKRREYLESIVNELDISDSVHFLGWQPQSEIAQLMQNSHVFILPSVTAKNGDKEGTPTVLLEAQSRGLPVVSTYHAGIPEIVEDDVSGILVPERNSDELYAALKQLASDPERWAEMGRAGREYVTQTHSIGAVSGQLVNLYRSLI